MPLERIHLVPDLTAMTPGAELLLAEADRRTEAFARSGAGAGVPAFVPSDARLSHAALAAVRAGGLTASDVFCEWGSGMGTTACLAASVGFEAYGIEIERELVEASEGLAEDFDLEVTFVHGSFVPEGGDELAMDSGDFETLSLGHTPAYDELGLDVDDFGLVFAYPWPGDEWAVENLFEHFAARGALLMTYRGREEVFLHRKV